MADLHDMVAFLDRELRTAAISDYPGAVNGLQLSNDGQIHRIVAAVDASLPVIEKACGGPPALLIVHHGMFWQGTQPLTGPFYRKIKAAMDGGLAVYSSHLPLDVHPVWGNNIQLAQAIGLSEIGPFLSKKGASMGLAGSWEGSRVDLVKKLETCLGGKVHLCPAGPERIARLGIVTGGAGSEVAAAAAEGVDTFVTGEGPHWTYSMAEELGMNLIYGGHYATETFGVKALAAALASRFGLDWSFVDHPSGL